MKPKITIGWLYPELMNIYGDRGNIIVLTKRCNWRGIETELVNLNPGFDSKTLSSCDILLMGGAQDKQQQIVNSDLTKKKKELSQMIEKGTPGLYVCGGYQFLGKYYKEADGAVIDGLGIFDLHTENPGINKDRLIGNLVIDSKIDSSTKALVGFENHGGRTYLGRNIEPLGNVTKGYGNNGEDGTEGARYKNSFGTYMHGPILPKNPHLADSLISLAIEKKYKGLHLGELDDSLENQAHEALLTRQGIK